ncbi:MAG TPA: GNAT family N-acetyltransferase [Lachnospiraceae bacterium]|nr:GNAT family N-acetyltransferase [Lachnospiraceae bacterium]
MELRRTEERDIDGILDLLEQVLKVHADIRPDIFVHGTTKYNREELKVLIADDDTPVYGAFDEKGKLLGYCFCAFKDQPDTAVLRQFKYMYIDDLCVDEREKGRGVAKALYEYVKERAKERGCYEITLNVWEGNDRARHFYEKMGLRPQKTYMEYIL